MPDADYFAAQDDAAAVAVIEVGGPVRAGMDVIFLKDLDPVDAIAQLEAVMTGCSYAEAGERPRAGQLLSSADVDSPFVLTVSDTLFEALASATAEDVVAAAAGIREFDPATATVVVEALAGLATRARLAGLRLYCWWTL